jgi:transketolase
MAALCNGIAAYGGYIPFCATFLNFTGYALGSVRLSALSKFRVIYVMTHDSIGLGEDGPTHQPVEMLGSLRSMPNMHVFRPCDGNEVAGCYAEAISFKESPSVLAFSRQGCPLMAGSDHRKVSLGAYVLQDSPDPKLILVGTGWEVGLCVAAKSLLADISVRVVSFPCWELFEKQTEEYKASVFLEGIPTLSVEAASRQGWERYAHAHVSLERFGLSGPGPQVLDKLGFSAENVADKAKKLLAFYPSGAPSLKRPLL